MRNLKKVLSLTLALVMMLGMMVVGAGAAEYTDAGDIEYKEAADVMSAIGVFDGMDGEFNPDGNLTRAQAAKIITYMVLGKAVADKLPNTNSKFTDCPDGSWYVGSVNYLSDTGIVSGVGGGKFDPEGNVTGVQFSKMLLGILGYDSKTEKFQDDPSWAANIAVRARQAELSADMTTQTVNSQAPLLREQACQMAFNTLKANMKYYEGGTDVTTPDGTTIKVGGQLRNVANDTATTKGHYNGNIDGVMQFCEQYFPTLKLEQNATSDFIDDFGRPAKAWTYDNEKIVTTSVANTLLATYTKDMNTSAGQRQIANDLKGYDFLVVDGGTDDGKLIYYLNGDESHGGVVSGNGSAQVAALTDDGKVVEVYTTNNTDKVCWIVVIEKTVATVSAAPTTRTNSDGVERVTIPGTNVRSIPTTHVNGWEDLAKGDVVLVATGKNQDDGNPVYYVEQAESITGVVSGIRSSDNALRIDGAYYTVSSLEGAKTGWDNDFKSEYTFYLDNGGFIIAGTTEAQVSTPAQYAVVMNNAWYQGTSLSTGEHGEVKLLLSDGTTVVGTVSKVDTKNVDKDATDSTKVKDVTNNKIVEYKVDSDGKYELKNVTNTVLTGDVAVTKGAANVVYDSDSAKNKLPVNSGTIFFVETGTGKDAKYTAYVGNGNVPSMTSDTAGEFYRNSAGMAVAVYIRNNTAVDNSASDYVYIPKDEPGTTSPIRYESVVNDGKVAYWEVNGVVINGEDGQTLKVTTDLKDAGTLAKGTLYKVDTKDASTEAVKTVSAAAMKTGVNLGKETVTVDTAGAASAYAVNADTQIIRITEEQTVQTIDWDGSFSDKTDEVAVIETAANSGVAKTVYIIENQSPSNTLAVKDVKIDGTSVNPTAITWGSENGKSESTAKTGSLSVTGADADKSFSLTWTVPDEADLELMKGTVPTKAAAANGIELTYTVTSEDGTVCWYKLTLSITA